jgi:hypothetical protein
MNLKLLDNGEMHFVVSLAVGEERASLDVPAYELVLDGFDALLPELAAVLPKATSPVAAALVTEGKRLDADFDRYGRGIHATLDAVGSLLPAAQAARVTGARERLFPEGLRILNTTYAEEGMEGTRAAGRLTDADRALLASFTLPDGTTLWQQVERWFAAAGALREYETRRLAAEQQDAAPALRHIDLRNRFIRIVRALETNAELKGDLQHPVLEAVRYYEARAAARATGAAVAVEPAPAAEPTPVEPTPA